MNERQLAEQYITKIKNCVKKGVPFDLSFARYKLLLSRKRCYYSHKLFVKFEDRTEENRGSWRTLDRVDNSKGYTASNTVACCGAINILKSIVENPINDLTFKQAIKALSRIEL